MASSMYSDSSMSKRTSRSPSRKSKSTVSCEPSSCVVIAMAIVSPSEASGPVPSESLFMREEQRDRFLIIDGARGSDRRCHGFRDAAELLVGGRSTRRAIHQEQVEEP